MVSVRPNTITQSISDQYVIVLYPLTERDIIKWYLADMRIHWVLHEIHFITTQIHPGFYIYTLERSFCLIVSIIINIRYISHCIIGLCSHSGLCRLRWIHWVLYDIHVNQSYPLSPHPDICYTSTHICYLRKGLFCGWYFEYTTLHSCWTIWTLGDLMGIVDTPSDHSKIVELWWGSGVQGQKFSVVQAPVRCSFS